MAIGRDVGMPTEPGRVITVGNPATGHIVREVGMQPTAGREVGMPTTAGRGILGTAKVGTAAPN